MQEDIHKLPQWLSRLVRMVLIPETRTILQSLKISDTKYMLIYHAFKKNTSVCSKVFVG
jgi:hypothetical protein